METFKTKDPIGPNQWFAIIEDITLRHHIHNIANFRATIEIWKFNHNPMVSAPSYRAAINIEDEWFHGTGFSDSDDYKKVASLLEDQVVDYLRKKEIACEQKANVTISVVTPIKIKPLINHNPDSFFVKM